MLTFFTSSPLFFVIAGQPAEWFQGLGSPGIEVQHLSSPKEVWHPEALGQGAEISDLDAALACGKVISQQTVIAAPRKVCSQTGSRELFQALKRRRSKVLGQR